MTQPPLTVALSLVLAAKMDSADRPALLATLHPIFGRSLTPGTRAEMSGIARVIPLPRVIPMPRRQFDEYTEQKAGPDQPEPDPAA